MYKCRCGLGCAAAGRQKGTLLHKTQGRCWVCNATFGSLGNKAAEVAGWGGRREARDAEERDPVGAEFCHFLSLLTKKKSVMLAHLSTEGDFCHGAGVCLADSPTLGEEGRAACASWCPSSHFTVVGFWGCCWTCSCWGAPGGSSISSHLGCAPRRGLLTGSQRFKYWGWPVGVSFAPCRSWWSFPHLKEETTS